MLNEILNINWNDFHFLRPIFLWLLVPVVVSLIFGLINSGKQAKWQKNIAPHLRKYVIKKGSENKIKWIRVLTILIISLAILGLSGPTWKKIEVPGKILETPVVIILDMSQSMMAADIQPNRLERAKFKIHDFLVANPHARTALIGFAGTAHTIVPLTSDYSIIYSHLDGLKPDLIPVQGSNLKTALQLSDSITQITDAPSRILIFTDDFTEKVFQHIREFANSRNTTVEIVPMNTIGGAEIPKPGSKYSFKDKNGNAIHSSLDTTILTKLRSLEKININPLTLDKSDMQLIAKKVGDNLKFQEEEQEKEDEWEDYGLWFVLPLLLLTLFWFRKGWVIFSLFAMISFSSCNSNKSFKDLWLTKNYQAQQQYDKGNYTEAADLYTDPMHKGVAWYKAGEYELAIVAFEKDSTAEGAYNLGMAYFKNGDYAGAELAFGKAVELNPEMGDAQSNKEIMQQLVTETDSHETPEAQEAEAKESAENIENKDQEDLGGGGQEATEEQMEKERKEETVATEKRKGKEMDEVPDDFESGKGKKPDNIVMQKVDDDPALFLKRKFIYQLKKGIVSQPTKKDNEW